MTDSRVSQVTTLVAGSDTSDRRISQITTLVAGTDTSDRRISQVVVLVAGKKAPRMIVVTTGGMM